MLLRFASGENWLFAASGANGVGHDEKALPLVRVAEVHRTKSFPFRIVPRFEKTTKDHPEAINREGSNVFHDDVSRSYLAYNP
ncbi:MAG: hypothetical protein WCE53_04665 [Candidatus Acidiferrum sp.]